MTIIPPRSSATANAARNTFNPIGTLVLNIARTPSENAISVAIGMARPRCMAASDGQTSANKSTGITIPPHAPMIGRSAFSLLESSPTRISRLISRPTERKNIAMRKSLMTCITVIVWPLWLKKLKFPIERLTLCCHNEKYQSLIAGTLAQMRARTVKKINTMLEFTCALNLLIKL